MKLLGCKAGMYLNNDAFQVTRYDSWIVVGILCSGLGGVFGIGEWLMVDVHGGGGG